MVFEYEDDDYEEEEEDQRSFTVTMAQLIATNKVLMQLTEELTTRHEIARKIIVCAVPLMRKDDPSRTLVTAAVRLLDKDIQTPLWGIGENEQ